MRSDYSILQVNQDDPEKMAELKAFAATFDHEIDRSQFPLYEAFRAGKRLGYFFVATVPILYPSFHPHSTPREIHEVTNYVREHTNYKGAAASVLVPKESPTFTPRIMKHLGFDETNLLLYTSRKC